MSSSKTSAATMAAASSEHSPGRSEPSVADREHDHPRLEPWLKVMLCSTLPTIVAFVLPPVFDVPMLGATALLFVVAMVMFVRRSRPIESSRS